MSFWLTFFGPPCIFFSWKTWRPPSFSRRFWSTLVSSSQKLISMAVTITIAFYCFHSCVTPWMVSSHAFFYLSDLVSPLFFVYLPTKNFSFGCHPWRVSPGPFPPGDATGCRSSRSKCENVSFNVLLNFKLMLSSSVGIGQCPCIQNVKVLWIIVHRYLKCVPGGEERACWQQF